MKLKNWVSITLIIISIMFLFMLMAEPIIINIFGLLGAGTCAYILARYSKFGDFDRRK